MKKIGEHHPDRSTFDFQHLSTCDWLWKFWWNLVVCTWHVSLLSVVGIVSLYSQWQSLDSYISPDVTSPKHPQILVKSPEIAEWNQRDFASQDFSQKILFPGSAQAIQPDPLLGCPRKLGSKVSKWVIPPLYPIYKWVVTHLLTSH